MRDFFDGIIVVISILVFGVLAFFIFMGIGFCMSGETEYVKSAEFVTTQAGAPRFQRYRTNDDGLEVVVDAETGVAYLMTGDGTTALVERDGEPMTIAEVGDAD